MSTNNTEPQDEMINGIINGEQVGEQVDEQNTGIDEEVNTIVDSALELAKHGYENNRQCKFVVTRDDLERMKLVILESANNYNSLLKQNQYSKKSIKESINELNEFINSKLNNNEKIEEDGDLNTHLDNLITHISNYNSTVNSNMSGNLKSIEFNMKGQIRGESENGSTEGIIKYLNIMHGRTDVYVGNRKIEINIRDICTESTLPTREEE
ncbi:hypothetical protein HOK00_03150 [bacterium]|jgi:hypothetical protein|nr:hypothetical protein [bacterium]